MGPAAWPRPGWTYPLSFSHTPEAAFCPMSQPVYTPANPYPQAGEVLDGKYRIEQMLGEGGMGAVAKATHMLRRAPVALKFMSPAVLALQGAVERFVNEG